MASVLVVSTLTPDEQALRLREFVTSRGFELPLGAAHAICSALPLSKPTPSFSLARKLSLALAAHKVQVSHTAAFEALAAFTGDANWMRARQRMLPFDSGKAPVFCLQGTRPDGQAEAPVLKTSLSDLGNDILATMKRLWPSVATAALCTIGIGKRMVTLDFEHPTAPWIAFRIASFEQNWPSKEDVPQLLPLPAKETLALVRRLERALEYAHPGLFVLGGLRNEALGPEYLFAPVLSNTEGTFHQECGSAMESVVWLGSCTGPVYAHPDGLLVPVQDGEILVKSRWLSQDDLSFVQAPLAFKQLERLVARMARVQRITGRGMTSFNAVHVHGGADPNDVHRLSSEKLEAAMSQRGLTAVTLAQAAGMTLNSVLRVQKYGFAALNDFPKLAGSLGLDDPNKLLPDEGEQSTGLRVESGATFLAALKLTHHWNRILGDSLRGEDAEEVHAIAESLQEYVELLQFSTGSLSKNVEFADGRRLEPLDESRLGNEIQELLGALSEMGVAVVVSRGVRFARTTGRLASMNNMPMHMSTLFFERVSALKKPEPQGAGLAMD